MMLTDVVAECYLRYRVCGLMVPLCCVDRVLRSFELRYLQFIFRVSCSAVCVVFVLLAGRSFFVLCVLRFVLRGCCNKCCMLCFLLYIP